MQVPVTWYVHFHHDYETEDYMNSAILLCAHFCCGGGGGEEKTYLFPLEVTLVKKIVTRDIMTLMFHEVTETKSLKVLKNMASVSSYKLHPLLQPTTKLYYIKNCMSIILFD